MSAPDRLAKLRRQRALLQEHATWLDDEIAQEEQRQGIRTGRETLASGSLVSPPQPPVTARVPENAGDPSSDLALAAETAPAHADAVDAQADEILDEYRVAPGALQRDVRKGCLLYFAASLAALALFVAVLYLVLRH